MQRDARQIVLLKRATVADARELYLLRYEAYLPQYGAYGSPQSACVQSIADFTARIEAGNTFKIVLGQEMVGGLTVEVQEENVCIQELYVKPDNQQMGVGQVALMHAELKYPSARYCARIISGEVAAMGLFRKMGYRQAQTDYEKPSDRITLVTMEKNASSMVTLSLEPLRREDLALAINWANDDPGADAYRLLWARGRDMTLTMEEFSKEFAFGKHYIGAPQMDYAIRAVEFDKVIGIVSLCRLDWEMHRGTLDFLLLDPKWRGGKVGQRAVEQLCTLAQEQYGFRGLSLTVLEEDKRAIGCFIKCGFAEVIRKPNVMRAGDGQPRTRIVMMRMAKEK